MTDTSKARLIEGTLACLRDKGLAATTSRDIAAASGVNLAGITYHYGAKDDLVAEALLEAMHRWIDPVVDILEGDLEPVARTTPAVQAQQRSLDEARELLPVYLEALVQSTRLPRLQEGVTALLGRVRSLMAAQITELVADGFLPKWVDAPAMAGLLVSVANGIAVHAAIEPEGPDPHVVSAQFLQMLLASRS